MYVSNRKHGYKVIRQYKRSDRVKLISVYGCNFTTTMDKLVANGYKFMKSKPAAYARGRS